jgi:hypothetical protein
METTDAVTINAVPASFHLLTGLIQTPLIEMRHSDGRSWLVDPEQG